VTGLPGAAPEPHPEEPRDGRRRRRRRERREARAFSSALPHILTTANLAAGFYAIVKAATGDPYRAVLGLLFAAVFDVLDGRVARRVGAESRFGAEYDSIADTVSFGVAPAILAFHFGDLQDLGWTGWVMAFLYTACAGLRLARFNVTQPRYRGRFEGLPSPAAAGMVGATIWFTLFLRDAGISLGVPASVAAMGLVVLGLLMVSSIPYRSFKNLTLRGSYGNVVLMVIGSVVLFSKPSVTFFPVLIAYTASGPIEWWWRRRTGRSLEEIAPVDGLPGEKPQGQTP